MQEHNEKSNIALRVTAVFLLLMTLTIYFMPNGLYAKYRASAQGNDSARVAAFAPQLVITQKSASNLSFSNVNHNLSRPIDIEFAVQNYTGSTVTEVDLEYSLIFYFPETFAKTAMIQLLTDRNTAITPMYNISDMFADADHTATGKLYKDAPAVPDETLTFAGNGTYNIMRGTTSVGTISYENVTMPTEYYLLFGFWTSDGTTLLDPTIKIDFKKADMPFVKVTINRTDFVLEGGAADIDNMILRTLPSDGMTEGDDATTQLDPELHTLWSELQDKITEDDISVIDFDKNKERWSVFYDATEHTVSVTQSKKQSDGTYIDKTYEKVKVGHPSAKLDGSDAEDLTATYVSCGKGYPGRLNVLFEQTQSASGS